MELWKRHAETAVQAPSWLTVVLFDRWFLSSEYRRSLCRVLAIPFTDEGLDEIVRFGNGSSFSGRIDDGRAQEMDVLNRWREFENDALMKDMLSEEVMELNNRLFHDMQRYPHPRLP